MRLVLVASFLCWSALEASGQPPKQDRKKESGESRFHPVPAKSQDNSCSPAATPIGAPDEEKELRDGYRAAFSGTWSSSIPLFGAVGLVFLAVLVGVFLSRRRVEAFDKKSEAPVEPDKDDKGRYRIG